MSKWLEMEMFKPYRIHRLIHMTMKAVNSIKEIKIFSKSLSDIKKINLRKIGLNKVHEPNIFVYNSRIFKILKYKIKPQINFSICYEQDNIQFELLSIEGIPKSLKRIFELDIKVDIYQEGEYCKAKRYLSLSLDESKIFKGTISVKILHRLLLKVSEIISIRFDKRFLNKLIKA